MPTQSAQELGAVAVTRLNALALLDADARSALRTASDRPRKYAARRELLAEGAKITETLLILSGWVARMRLLPDGRRQILNLMLPGDLIGLCEHDRPVASSSYVALTNVQACVAPDVAVSSSLKRAYTLSRALDEAYLLNQITRLGRLDAHERIVDLLLELLERLELAGLAQHDRYLLPVTQEMLADTLGLTSVHVNRTLQALRREGAIDWQGRQITLPKPDVLRQQVGRVAVRVTYPLSDQR